MKAHSDKWFEKWERRINEPIKNTEHYYNRAARIKIIYFGWTLVLLVWGIVNLIQKHIYFKKFRALAGCCLSGGRTVTNDGAPGCGKTFSGSNMAYFLAQERWETLQRDYFLQRGMVAEWTKTGNTDKLYAFQSLEKAFCFYANNISTYIPCLVSSIPLREYGTDRMSYELTPELFCQIECVPEYSVFFNDESGLWGGCEISKLSNDDYNATWRFIRHFFDGMCVNTNQDAGQNSIQQRRSTDYVNHLYGRERIMEPTFLQKRIERKERRYFKRLRKGRYSAKRASYLAQKLYYLKKYEQTIGFARVYHQLSTPQGVAVGEREYYIFPAIGGVKYDDRCFRNLYKAKDKPVALRGWDRMLVDEYDSTAYKDIITGAHSAASGGQ